MKRLSLLLALLIPVAVSAQTPEQNFSTIVTILNDGSTPSGAVQLKVAKAFAYADIGDWERLVDSAGYVIETPAAGEDKDIFSVGTYADPDDTSSEFTAVSSALLNKGLAIHALNELGQHVRRTVRRQWEENEGAARAGDTPAEAKKRAATDAQTTADSAAKDDRSIEP